MTDGQLSSAVSAGNAVIASLLALLVLGAPFDAPQVAASGRGSAAQQLKSGVILTMSIGFIDNRSLLLFCAREVRSVTHHAHRRHAQGGRR
jgi:hypothetical protein